MLCALEAKVHPKDISNIQLGNLTTLFLKIEQVRHSDEKINNNSQNSKNYVSVNMQYKNILANRNN